MLKENKATFALKYLDDSIVSRIARIQRILQFSGFISSFVAFLSNFRYFRVFCFDYLIVLDYFGLFGVFLNSG